MGGAAVEECHMTAELFVPLRDVKHVLWGGFVQSPSVDGPQAAQDPEQGAFSTAVGPSD